MSEHTGQLNPPLKALEICNQGTVMHPRKRGNEKLECVKNAFDGAQRCVSSDDHNAPYDTFLLARLCQSRAMEGPHTCSPPSSPHPPEDVIRAKLTVILRLWRPVTGCFELKQKTHYNPKRPWKKSSGNISHLAPPLARFFSQDPQPGHPPPPLVLVFHSVPEPTDLPVAVAGALFSFRDRQWWERSAQTRC